MEYLSWLLLLSFTDGLRGGSNIILDLTDQQLKLGTIKLLQMIRQLQKKWASLCSTQSCWSLHDRMKVNKTEQTLLRA